MNRAARVRPVRCLLLAALPAASATTFHAATNQPPFHTRRSFGNRP